MNLYGRRPEASCSFYLLNDAFVFFSYWKVQASVELKFGPISYRGPFNVARRPALFVPFSDTKSIATAFDAALTVPSEPMSFAAYQALSAQGDPVLLEMGLKNQAALGRMAYYFQLDDFGAWLWLIRLPWNRGGFGPRIGWERILRVTPSREHALVRAAFIVQSEFPPRGFEFRPKVGLVPERRPAVRGWGRTKARTRRNDRRSGDEPAWRS